MTSQTRLTIKSINKKTSRLIFRHFKPITIYAIKPVAGFTCSYFWSKRTQSQTKVSRDRFKGQGDHFRVNFFSKFQNFQMFLSLAKTSTKLNKSAGRPF